eukprot:COSAG04_NODE_23098_length_344_cov_0.628571_1_plen_83_part_01
MPKLGRFLCAAVGTTHADGDCQAERLPADDQWLLQKSAFACRYNVSADDNAVVLGHYEGTSHPSLVQVKLASHTAIWSANPAL